VAKSKNGVSKRSVAKKPVDRCVGCGQRIGLYFSVKDPGDRAVDIRIGSVLSGERRAPGRPPKNTKDGFRSEEAWGRMHLRCFLRAMESPDRFLEEMGLMQ
jgi:hypothetical protein